MGISGKDVQVWMWTALKFSMRWAFTLIKNHPFVSCPVLFLLLLYICFPSIFWISIYSSAFLVLVVSVAKIYIGHQNAKSFRRGEEGNSDAESIKKDAFPRNRNQKPYGRARSVRRRRPYETSRDSSLHTSEDEKNTIFMSTFNSEMMVDKSSLTEERPKEIREIQVDSVTSNGDSSSSNVSLPFPHKSCGRSRKFGSRDVEIESSEGTDEEEDEQDREANNKAVQWTETDQKNLMDLGLSEIERNKRLESLIARRRARKMLSLQVRRPAPKLVDNLENHGLMTSLVIPRNNNSLLATPSNSNLFSPMPGSAPSVLLPNCNPFDLPYDAQEEKPILTGGSFQLEFKDMTLVKPENVGSGASIPWEQKEDQQQTSLSHDSIQNEGVSEGIQNFQVKDQLDEKDTCKIIEVEVCQSPNSKLNTVTTNSIIEEEVLDSKQEENNGVQTEDSSEKLSSASSSDEVVSIYKVDKDAVLRSLGSQLVRNMSINREESSQMESAENNCTSPLFEKNKMLEHLYHADKALHLNLHTPMSSIASDLQVEVSEISSPILTDDGIPLFPEEELSVLKEDKENDGNEDIKETSYAVPWIHDNESKEEYNTLDMGFSGRKESENDILSFPVMDKMQQLKEDPVADISKNGDSEKQEQPRYPSLMSKGEFSSKILQNNDDDFNVRAADDKTDLLIEQGNREQTKVSETSSPNSVDCTGNQPEKIVEHHCRLEPVGKNVDAKVSEDIEAESESKKDKADGSTAFQDNDTQESIQVDEEEHHHMEEMRSSGVHPQLSNRQIQELLPELVLLPHFHISSSSTFSPTSVLQPNISLDPSSLSRFSVEVHQIQPERVENSTLNEARGESSSTAHSASRAETLKESSNHSTSTVEANSVGSVQEDMETSNLFTGAAHENEVKVVPEGSCRKLDSDTKEVSSNRISSYCSEAALSKTVEESNSYSYSTVLTPAEETNSAGIVSDETKDDRNLTVTKDSCDELHKHKAENKALPALHNPIGQPNGEIKMNAPGESSIEEEINGNPNTEKKVVAQIDRDGTSKDRRDSGGGF